MFSFEDQSITNDTNKASVANPDSKTDLLNAIKTVFCID